MKITKARKALAGKIDSEKRYPLVDAVKLMLECNSAKFDPTAEAHFTLGIDPRHADQQIRDNTTLPHGIGKTIRVIAICGEDKVEEAKAAGAVEAGSTDLIDKISKGWMDFDSVVATPDQMKNLAKVARVLGPRGLMPNPKSGTVTPDVKKAITEISGGRLEFRNDKSGVVHTIFGKVSFADKKLLENLEALIKAINDAKPSGQKGLYIKTLTINSTMGPGIKVQTAPDEA